MEARNTFCETAPEQARFTATSAIAPALRTSAESDRWQPPAVVPYTLAGS